VKLLSSCNESRPLSVYPATTGASTFFGTGAFSGFLKGVKDDGLKAPAFKLSYFDGWNDS